MRATAAAANKRSEAMRSLTTLLTGVSLGAGAMYLMDPERGDRRRAELRDALAEIGDSELVTRARQLEPVASELIERARRLEPVTAMRELGGGLHSLRQLGAGVAAARQFGLGALLDPAVWRTMGRRGWRRRGTLAFAGRDWLLLGGLVGVIGAGLWLARRAAHHGGIEVLRTMTLESPVERVYEFWNDFENFPRFMSHVREVKRVGPDRTHWVVAGPGGAPIEWDAVVTGRVPNEEIGWRTVEGSLIEHQGSVRFRAAGSSATRIEVRMTYRPVGGALGHGLAALFGRDPDRVIGDDLARLATQLRGTRSAVGEAGPWR
jgi:uncharacterized membrane protein